MTASTTLTAATTSAASRAQPKLSTVSTPSVRASAARRIRASATSTSRKPRTSVSGSRSAASTGGITAFSAATITATRSAPQKPSMWTPGRIAAATIRATPVRTTRRGEGPAATGALGLPGRGLAVGPLGAAGHLIPSSFGGRGFRCPTLAAIKQDASSHLGESVQRCGKCHGIHAAISHGRPGRRHDPGASRLALRLPLARAGFDRLATGRPGWPRPGRLGPRARRPRSRARSL